MKVKLAVLLLILLLSSSAQAVPSTLTATSVRGPSLDFTISFNDNGDGLFELAELTSFSGITGFSNGTRFFDQVYRVPSIVGIALATNNQQDGWVFATGIPLIPNTTFITFELASSYAYKTTATPVADPEPVDVPEPATMLLMGLGLLGLGYTRKKQA